MANLRYVIITFLSTFGLVCICTLLKLERYACCSSSYPALMRKPLVSNVYSMSNEAVILVSYLKELILYFCCIFYLLPFLLL